MLAARRRFVKVLVVLLLAAILVCYVFYPLLYEERPRQEEGYDDDVVLLGRGSLDSSERYWVHRAVSLSSGGHHRGPCLALHSSLGQTHHVVTQALLWTSSLSVAVFVAPEDRDAVRAAILYLRRCFPLVRRRATFHVVYPANFSAPGQDGHYEGDHDDGDALLALLPGSCHQTSPEDVLRALESRKPDHEMPYPQNIMRNTARSCCRGSHVMVADVDMLPPGDGRLASRLRDFLAASTCDKCAFTLPVWEVATPVEEGIPRDKEDLRRLHSLNLTRPFHWELFQRNQRALEPYRWLNMAAVNNSNACGVAYNATFEFFAEPVFVVARGAPDYDEGFLGFGFTRNSQAYEMVLAGWRFVVLDEAFLVHRGFQSITQRPEWRDLEIKSNLEKFKWWLRSTVVRYDRDPLRLLYKYGVKKANVEVRLPATKGKPKPKKPS